MNHTEFIENYIAIAKKALDYLEKSRRKGLLALDEDLNDEKADSRDIFECGIRFVVDGIDRKLIDKILSNIIEHEKDERQRILKLIQKEAVLSIQEGMNPRMLLILMNSYTDIQLKDDEIFNINEYGQNGGDHLENCVDEKD